MNNKLKEYANEWFKSYYNYALNQLYIQLHITRLCENRCPHCYFNDLKFVKGSLTFNDCCHIIDDVVFASKKLGLKPLIDFTGGDPLLHPDIYNILRYGVDNGVSVGLKCNAHQITIDSIKKLKKCNVERIYLSLEGLELVNDSIRGKGDFNRTIKTIALLKENGFYTRVHMTLSKKNLNEVIPLMNFFLDNKFIIDVFSWSRFWSDQSPDLLISKSEFESILTKQLDFLERIYNSDDFYVKLDNGRLVPKIGFEFKEHIWFPFLYKKQIIDPATFEQLSLIRNSVNCTSTRNVYIIDNNGDVSKCRKIASSKIGNIYNDSLSDIIKNRLNYEYNNLNLNSECGKCKYFNVCAGCPAMSFAKTGSCLNKDPDCFIHNI